MKAITQQHYGPVENLKIEELEAPQIGDQDVLVEVHATSVTTADWRFRTASFPAGMRLIGRLVTGLFRPRNRVTGREFAGRVVAVGARVTRFRVGDDVFGARPAGANAERIALPESGALALMPSGLSHAEAVALPFGATTSLQFLEDMVKVQPGERVLIVGASGGVGVYAVQIAKQLGAEVTGVCSTENVEFVRSLGADHVVDYRTQDPRELGETWDVILDMAYKTTFRSYRAFLSERGRHAFVEGSLREMLQAVTTSFGRGPRVIAGVANDTAEAFERLRARAEAGAIRPVIGHRFDWTEVAEAHRVVERRHRKGAVVLDWPAARDDDNTVPLRRAS